MGKHLPIREKYLRKAHDEVEAMIVALHAASKDTECNTALLENLGKVIIKGESLRRDVADLLADESVDVS